MSTGIVQSALLQRPVGAHGPKTFMEANTGREMKIARDGELTRGQSVHGDSKVLSRRRIARADASEALRERRSVSKGEESDFKHLGYIASLLLASKDDEREFI